MKISLQHIRRLNNVAIEQYITSNKNIHGSTVFQGTLYENVVMRELGQKLRMSSLERIGGAHDGGVDITAEWNIAGIEAKMSQVLGAYADHIPKTRSINGVRLTPIINKINQGKELIPLRTLIQCKAFTSAKIAPKELRELAGTFSSLVPDRERDKTIMFMCSPHILTADGVKLINKLRLPLIYLQIGLLQFMAKSNKFDLEGSGHIISYYENEYAIKLLEGCRVAEWLKLHAYNHPY